ncbi:hypothetical protein PHET_01849, partial [Paragonimus heterotremus]
VRDSGLVLRLRIFNVHLLPEFEDVDHVGDNEFILKAQSCTYAHRLQQPLLNVIHSYCRHPLPSWYYLSMKAYRDRQTQGRLKICDRSVKRSANCPARLIRGKYYYERSVNRQCGRNRAAPLPDDPNSFYCTRNTPLVNELFGEITKERLVDETESSCDGYRRNCMACVNQAERILQTEQANATHCVYAHVNRVHDTDEVEEDDREPSQDGAIQPETAAQCCSLSCYNTPACMTYHSAACYKDKVDHNLVPDSDVCLEGTSVDGCACLGDGLKHIHNDRARVFRP